MTYRFALKSLGMLLFVGTAMILCGNASIQAELLLGAVALLATALMLYLRGRTSKAPLPYNFVPSEDTTQGPGLMAGLLFVLLMSGPPKLRSRDPLASIRGDVDAVVVFNLLVWGVAGLWLGYYMLVGMLEGQPRFRFWLPQKIGLALILCLGVSAVVSAAPALTLFKVYQMIVMLLFSLVFVRRYGVEACLHKLFLGSALLVISIAVSALVAPSLVLYGSRLTGDMIAPAGSVSALALILLLTSCPRLRMTTFLVLFMLFVIVLVFSRTRSAYAVIIGVLASGLFIRPKIRALRGLSVAVLAVMPILLISGLVPQLTQWVVRDPDPKSLSTLSDRTGLWTYLADVTLTKSPWIGLGYYSASRVYGPKYNPGLGNAHSAFMEVFVGGGILSTAVMILLCCVLLTYAIVLLCRQSDRFSFATSSLLVTVLLLGQVGEAIDAGPVGFTFWSLAATLPLLHERLGAKIGSPEQTGRRC